MSAAGKPSVVERVREFFGSRIVPPRVLLDPATNTPYLQPSVYSFDADSPHVSELERIARAASAASGIVPTPEDLTGEAMAQMQAAAEQSGAPPGA